MALLHLLGAVAPWAGWVVEAVTVDHGLRPEAADEALFVADFCATQGIPHSALHWHRPEGAGNLMDQARRARARLIADWARGRGIGHVALGHTADDQAESFLMNLGRAAGLDGLSAMRQCWKDQGIRWVRPLLGHSRAALRDYLRVQGIGWIDDPSNENPRFTRVKARRALHALAPLGITAESIAASARHLAAARDALVLATAQAAEACVTEQGGALRLDPARFFALPDELRRRLLLAALLWFGGADYPPRATQVARLGLALAEGRAATLAGLRFRPQRDALLIQREPRAVMPPVASTDLWDHRWRLHGPHAPDLRIGALGAGGLATCPDWRATGLGRETLLASPAIWQGQRLIAAPLAGKGAEWQATLSPSFGMFILSH